MLNVDYVVINELKNSIWRKAQLEISLIYMMRKKIEMHSKMIVLCTFENMTNFKPFKSP
jgi:hypothetical protein